MDHVRYIQARAGPICAQLEKVFIVLIFARGKGKIEKFFWSVDKSFEPEVRVSKVRL